MTPVKDRADSHDDVSQSNFPIISFMSYRSSTPRLMDFMERQIKDNELNAAHIVRERESYRYLNTANIHAYVDDAEQPLPAARPGTDSALIAFAQLSLLQLNAQRTFVCLLDRTYCYTVAEAIASSKLRPLSGNRDTKHGLILCGTAICHVFSLPSLILEAAIKGLLSAGEPNLLPLPVLVIPDLRNDDRFCSVPVVAADDSLRYCVGVPIKSYNGAFIGVICVTNSQPQVGLSHVDTEFLRDMSKTIMDHLDLYRSRQEFDRSTRMVRGLGSFVENKATMSGLSEDSQHRSLEGELGREGTLNNLQQEALQKTEKVIDSQLAATSDSEEPSFSSATVAKDWCDQVQQPSSQVEPLTRPPSKSSVESWLSQSKPVTESHLTPDDEKSEETDQAVSASNPPTKTTTTSPPPPVDDLQQLFSRAANIIRESIEVEGVLFFDASVGYWGGLLESGKHGRSEGGSSSTSTTSTTSSSGDDDALPTRSTIRTHTEETTCDVFGFSMTDGSSIDGKKASASHLTVPERFLRILLRRYPTGKIFNFTADGRHVSDTETDEDFVHIPAPVQEAPSRIRRKRYNSYSRANEAALIINVFPGARSVLAFPLWDSHRERWFAGGVVWTRTPTRVFSVKGELSYLRAFGTVAMAEVARMDAQTANKSKTTLLSSISHELRSPLHGILGGVEILHNTEIDIFQSNVIHTVETCGIMLLDTIEHLLTQSEINQSVRLAKLRRRERRMLPRTVDAKSQAIVINDTPSNIEMDDVVEEVVESMFAGHEFMHMSRPPPKSIDDENKSPSMVAGGLSSEQDASPSSVEGDVKVILDIKNSASWSFVLETGALRRIVMNLFSNALKYTTAGYIKVTMTQRELSKKRTAQLSEIKITVEDTGKGIGAEYLSNHLFKPFSQEDTLSQGTGLGLSITHQIVASLDGKIDVQSTVGRGTIMSVFLRLTRTVPTEDPQVKSMFLTQVGRTRGLRVSLFGFHEVSGATSDEVLKADMGWQLPRASIKLLCQDWLHMDVLDASEMSIRPDVYIATQAGAQKLATMNKAGIFVQPVVVICPSAAIAHDLTKSSKTSDNFGVFEYLSQPCGPRKLAKTLTLCLDRWANKQIEQAIEGSSPLSSVEPVHVQPTLPLNTKSTPFTSPQSALSLSVADGHLSASPNPHIERNQAEHHPSRPSKPLEVESPRPASPRTVGLTQITHVAPFLIVDDNDINLKLLSVYLSRKPLPFTTAVDGVLAVEAYKSARGNFSCVFMDIQMPRMDGIAATRMIREYERQEKLEAVTVVALTGLATEEKQREAEASGINEFFAKPVRLKALDVILKRTARAVGYF